MPQSNCSCRQCTTGYTIGWLVTQWYPKLLPALPEGEDSAIPLIHQTCAKSSQQRTWQSFSPLCDPGWRCWWPGSISPCLCNATLHPFIGWHKPFQCHHMGESQRGNSLRPHPSAEDLPIPTLSASFPPYKRELPSEIPPYWDVYHNLSSIGEALVYGSWIMAPNSLIVLWGPKYLALCPPGHHQSESSHPDLRVLAWHVHRYHQLLPTVLIVWCHYYHPPSFHYTPPHYKHQNTCSGWLHPLGRSALSGVICRPTQWLGWVCIWTTNGQQWCMVATESLQEWLGTFGDHKEISNDGGKPLASTLLHFLPPDNLSVAEIGLDCICLMTTHVLKDILAVFHK